MKVFFCKYNDPIYVKMEKLEIMIKLANANNIDQVGGCTTCWHHVLVGFVYRMVNCRT